MKVSNRECHSKKIDSGYRLLTLCLMPVIICFVTLQVAIPPSSSNEASGRKSEAFVDAFNVYMNTRAGRSHEILREAAISEKRKEHFRAAAGYLVGSIDAVERAEFEEAKKTLDIAFSLAAKLPVDEREQFVKASADVLHNQLRARRSLEGNFEIYHLNSLIAVENSIPGFSSRQKVQLVINLAYAHLRNKNYKQAVDLLEKQLSELETSDYESRYSCLNALARSFDEQRNIKNAQQCYVDLLTVAKKTHSDHSADALNHYLQFLLKNELYDDAVPIADLFINAAWMPSEARYLDRRSWGLLARNFAKGKKYAVAERYYKAAFYLQTHDPNPPTNSGYGQTAREWAELLVEQKKYAEAVEVLRDAIKYARTLKPEVAERNLTSLSTLCVQYQRAAGREKEALITEAESSIDAKRLVDSKRAEADKAIANPSKNYFASIKALTDRAYSELDASNDDAGVRDLKTAITLYEASPHGTEALQKYYCFQKIRLRFKKLGREQEGIELLWRIVKARMQSGYADPPFSGSQCGGPTPTADYELLHTTVWTKTDADKKMAEEFLSLAKASGKSENIIFALSNMREPLGRGGEREISIEEQIETERANGKNRILYIMSVFNTTRSYIRAQQFDKAYTKYKQLLEVSKGQPTGALNLASLLSGLASEFEFFKDYRHSEEVMLKAFELSFTVPQQYFRERIAKSLVEFTSKDASERRGAETRNILDVAKKIALSQGNAGTKFVEQFEQASADLKKN